MTRRPVLAVVGLTTVVVLLAGNVGGASVPSLNTKAKSDKSSISPITLGMQALSSSQIFNLNEAEWIVPSVTCSSGETSASSLLGWFGYRRRLFFAVSIRNGSKLQKGQAAVLSLVGRIHWESATDSYIGACVAW